MDKQSEFQDVLQRSVAEKLGRAILDQTYAETQLAFAQRELNVVRQQSAKPESEPDGKSV